MWLWGTSAEEWRWGVSEVHQEDAFTSNPACTTWCRWGYLWSILTTITTELFLRNWSVFTFWLQIIQRLSVVIWRQFTFLSWTSWSLHEGSSSYQFFFFYFLDMPPSIGCSWRSYAASEPPTSTSWAQELHACATTLGLCCAWDGTQGFLHVRQALFNWALTFLITRTIKPAELLSLKAIGHSLFLIQTFPLPHLCLLRAQSWCKLPRGWTWAFPPLSALRNGWPISNTKHGKSPTIHLWLLLRTRNMLVGK